VEVTSGYRTDNPDLTELTANHVPGLVEKTASSDFGNFIEMDRNLYFTLVVKVNL
jgi:hypothetical protein